MLNDFTKITDDGRVVIPAAIRRDVGFQAGDPLFIESDGESLLLSPLSKVVAEVQAAFAPYRVEGVSIVDELIAERRAEAAAESTSE